MVLLCPLNRYLIVTATYSPCTHTCVAMHMSYAQHSVPWHWTCHTDTDSVVDCIWNVMAHAQKPDFVFQRYGRVHLGASVQLTTGSWGVRISGSNAGYSMFWGNVKSTGYPLHSPVSPSLSLPCVTVCHHISTGLYRTTFEFHSVPWYVAYVQIHVLSEQWYGDLLATLCTSANTIPSQKCTHITVYDDSSFYVAVHCPAGTFAGEKQQQCTRCPRGFYQNRDRQGSCIRCPMGTYTREEGTSSYTVLYAPVTMLFFTRHKLEHSCLQKCQAMWSVRYAPLCPDSSWTLLCTDCGVCVHWWQDLSEVKD